MGLFPPTPIFTFLTSRACVFPNLTVTQPNLGLQCWLDLVCHICNSSFWEALSNCGAAWLKPSTTTVHNHAGSGPARNQTGMTRPLGPEPVLMGAGDREASSRTLQGEDSDLRQRPHAGMFQLLQHISEEKRKGEGETYRVGDS